MTEYKRLRRYSDEEIYDLVRKMFIRNSHVYWSKEESLRRWTTMSDNQKLLLESIAVSVYRHIWYEKDKGTEESELSYPTQAYGSIPAFHSVEEERAFWDTHNMVDFQEDVYERDRYASDRETKFLKWASLTWQRLDKDYFDSHGVRSAENTHKILAECAYDLAFYLLKEVDILGLHGYSKNDDTIRSIIALDVGVDFTWPEKPVE